MAKRTDITEKLNFNENPIIVIKNEKMEVNADAPTILKIMGIMGDGENISPQSIVQMYELLFSKKDRKKIDELHLNFADFQVLITSAIELVTGENTEGE